MAVLLMKKLKNSHSNWLKILIKKRKKEKKKIKKKTFYFY